MTLTRVLLGSATVACLGLPVWIFAGQPKPQTAHEFECYIQAAEARMEARKAFLLADEDTALNKQLVTEKRVVTIPANGSNPHKLPGGHLYDWHGAVFISGATVERVIRMLQDYDHRPQHFPETISTSRLLCRTGRNRFTYTMRMKEPAVIDVESDVTWEQVDAQRWRCRSYSTKTAEVGKDHGYLRQLYSYWRFAQVEKGVYVEAETITLSDEFGGMTRALGSMLMGINPEKSLKHSLESMRESVLKPGLEIPALPEGLPACGASAPRPAGCTQSLAR
jgi:hypothetical protein